MDRVATVKFNRWYALTGLSAIVIGAALAAFTAKSPSTLAMWASAYLVLVVGVAQLWFAVVVARLTRRRRLGQVGWFYGLYNGGSAVVIASSVLKYNGYTAHVGVTIAGTLLVLAALALMLGWLATMQRSSVRTLAYVVVLLLAVSSLIGVVLAGLG